MMIPTPGATAAAISWNSARRACAACRPITLISTSFTDLSPRFPIDETLRALDDLIRAGKVRYIGTSTFAAWQVMESLWVSQGAGAESILCVKQPPYHIFRSGRIERELLPMAQTYGFGIIPWSPLAFGLLSGKYRRGTPPPSGSRLTRLADGGDLAWQEFRYPDSVFDVVEGLQAQVEKKGCTMSQFALAWCMHQPGITSPIIGPRTMAQLEDNLGAMEVTITDEDRALVDKLVAPGLMVASFYWADFGPHPYRW